MPCTSYGTPQVAGMVAAARELGPVRIAVNNAGIGGEMAPVAGYSTQGWRHIMAVNLDSVFFCMREEIPARDLGWHDW